MAKSQCHKILIVDDDEAVRESLGVLLSLSGFEVACFESGPQLINGIEHQNAEALIIDVNMPGMSGLELVDWLNNNGHDIPVVLISAKMSAATVACARKSGVRQFLEKPFSDASLIDAIRALHK